MRHRACVAAVRHPRDPGLRLWERARARRPRPHRLDATSSSISTRSSAHAGDRGAQSVFRVRLFRATSSSPPPVYRVDTRTARRRRADRLERLLAREVTVGVLARIGDGAES